MSSYPVAYAKRRSTVDLTDPWGWLVAGGTGGGMFLVTASPGLALGSAVGVVVAKAGVEYWQGPRRLTDESRALLKRAKRAHKRVARQDRRLHRGGPKSELASTTGLVVDDVAEAAYRLTAIQASRQNIDVAELESRANMLRQPAGTGKDALRQQRQRALDIVQRNIEVADRLEAAYALLLAKTEAAVLGLESLEGRMIELRILNDTIGDVGDPIDQIDALNDGLDALRGTLEELSGLGDGDESPQLPRPPTA